MTSTTLTVVPSMLQYMLMITFFSKEMAIEGGGELLEIFFVIFLGKNKSHVF